MDFVSLPKNKITPEGCIDGNCDYCRNPQCDNACPNALCPSCDGGCLDALCL